MLPKAKHSNDFPLKSHAQLVRYWDTLTGHVFSFYELVSLLLGVFSDV